MLDLHRFNTVRITEKGSLGLFSKFTGGWIREYLYIIYLYIYICISIHRYMYMGGGEGEGE